MIPAVQHCLPHLFCQDLPSAVLRYLQIPIISPGLIVLCFSVGLVSGELIFYLFIYFFYWKELCVEFNEFIDFSKISKIDSVTINKSN